MGHLQFLSRADGGMITQFLQCRAAFLASDAELCVAASAGLYIHIMMNPPNGRIAVTCN